MSLQCCLKPEGFRGLGFRGLLSRFLRFDRVLSTKITAVELLDYLPGVGSMKIKASTLHLYSTPYICMYIYIYIYLHIHVYVPIIASLKGTLTVSRAKVRPLPRPTWPAERPVRSAEDAQKEFGLRV